MPIFVSLGLLRFGLMVGLCVVDAGSLEQWHPAWRGTSFVLGVVLIVGGLWALERVERKIGLTRT